MIRHRERPAEWIKLHDATWAAWVPGPTAHVGEIVRVGSYSGVLGATLEVLESVLWRDERGAVCTVRAWKRLGESLRGRCGSCNSIELWAMCPRYGRQEILVDVIDGRATYEYTGRVCAPSANDSGSGELFACLLCGMRANSVEYLVGLQDENDPFPKRLQGDSYAMSSIRLILSRSEWDLEALQGISAIVSATGRGIGTRVPDVKATLSRMSG